ncbi:MAG: hypothetical protein JZU65_06980, partial [Chlorobium sp.]|nr:hypothetical protein [Chlorobium sp.]
MALIKCSECNKDISDKATTCPGCGCPTPFNLNNPAEPADILSCSKCGYKGHVSTAILTNFGSRTECPKCHSGL